MLLPVRVSYLYLENLSVWPLSGEASASLVEMVDTTILRVVAARRAGSNPAGGTIFTL